LFHRFILSPHGCCCPIVCWCHHHQNSHQHLAIALLLQLPCQYVIVTAPSHTPPSLHHRSCCTIAVAIAASQSSHCCSHSAIASPMQFPAVIVLHHCSACLTIDLLQHCHDVIVLCHIIVAFHVILATRHGQGASPKTTAATPALHQLSCCQVVAEQCPFPISAAAAPG